MHYTYAQSYAFHYPRYSAMYRTRSRAACEGARRDILATLALHREQSAYVGKLYAELDAARDQLAVLNR